MQFNFVASSTSAHIHNSSLSSVVIHNNKKINFKFIHIFFNFCLFILRRKSNNNSNIFNDVRKPQCTAKIAITFRSYSIMVAKVNTYIFIKIYVLNKKKIEMDEKLSIRKEIFLSLHQHDKIFHFHLYVIVIHKARDA